MFESNTLPSFPITRQKTRLESRHEKPTTPGSAGPTKGEKKGLGPEGTIASSQQGAWILRLLDQGQ